MYISELISLSLCKNCRHRLSRTISTEGLPIYEEEGSFTGAEFVLPEDASDFEAHACTILCIDLDHIVLECSRFDEAPTNNFGGILYNKDIEDLIC
jgi:hypothetical protein